MATLLSGHLAIVLNIIPIIYEFSKLFPLFTVRWLACIIEKKLRQS